ncbi:MAG: hypothetical protein U5L72_19505 [Bacteroidales bacterium]|nr:hypothetical protein [Bacteroidales bacterium]
MMQGTKNDIIVSELTRIIRKIDRDIQNEEEPKVFDRYLNKVHPEFHTRLKKIHPELSPGELRLSGYLRMNVSS